MHWLVAVLIEKVLKVIVGAISDYVQYKQKEKKMIKKNKGQWNDVKKEKDPIIRAKRKRDYFASN